MAVDPTLPPPHLEPCPWCGNPLEVTWRKHNPRASCRIEGCFGYMRVAFALDDPQQVEAWNRRALVNELRELLQDAKRAMTELHQAAIPDESTEGVPAIIPPAAFRKFVDTHAMLCFCLHQRGHNPPQEVQQHD